MTWLKRRRKVGPLKGFQVHKVKEQQACNFINWSSNQKVSLRPLRNSLQPHISQLANYCQTHAWIFWLNHDTSPAFTDSRYVLTHTSSLTHTVFMAAWITATLYCFFCVTECLWYRWSNIPLTSTTERTRTDWIVISPVQMTKIISSCQILWH